MYSLKRMFDDGWIISK